MTNEAKNTTTESREIQAGDWIRTCYGTREQVTAIGHGGLAIYTSRSGNSWYHPTKVRLAASPAL